MKLFFYGTLMDPDVLAVVTGGQLPPDMEEAFLHGFRRTYLARLSYPLLVAHPAGRVAGILAHGLDAEAVHRLMVFEGSEYHLVPVPVTTHEGHLIRVGTFLCDRRMQTDNRDWRLPVWQRRHKRLFLRRAEVLMRRYGTQARLARMPSGLPILAPKEPKFLFGKPPALWRFVG